MVICDRLKMPDSFIDKLKQKWNEGKFVCVGLDPSKINSADSIFPFNKSIIDSTHDLVLAYKPQSAFYEAFGADGFDALKETIKYIRQNYPDIPVILDAKRADIGSTNEGYIKAAFENLEADAITIHPYLGQEAMQPFLDLTSKGIIVLVKTSNPGSSEFQDLVINGKPLYQIVAENVAKNWNSNGNCAVVVGATYSQELKKVREIIGDMPILVPGIGAQGGDLNTVLENGLNSKKEGLIINSSRGIIYAQNPRQAAIELDQKIRGYING